MKVYVVESGDYEQREIDLVADSVEAAVAAVKKLYSSADSWREEQPRDDAHVLIGEFPAIPSSATRHFSPPHTRSFYIESYEVVSNTGLSPKEDV